jgi:hypothetical protein
MTHLTLDLLSTTVFGSSILQDPELASVLFDTCQTCLYTRYVCVCVSVFVCVRAWNRIHMCVSVLGHVYAHALHTPHFSLRRAMNPMCHIPLLKLIPTKDTKAMAAGAARCVVYVCVCVVLYVLCVWYCVCVCVWYCVCGVYQSL